MLLSNKGKQVLWRERFSEYNIWSLRVLPFIDWTYVTRSSDVPPNRTERRGPGSSETTSTSVSSLPYRPSPPHGGTSQSLLRPSVSTKSLSGGDSKPVVLTRSHHTPVLRTSTPRILP